MDLKNAIRKKLKAMAANDRSLLSQELEMSHTTMYRLLTYEDHDPRLSTVEQLMARLGLKVVDASKTRARKRK